MDIVRSISFNLVLEVNKYVGIYEFIKGLKNIVVGSSMVVMLKDKDLFI